jgi:MSHA biogenesis protein MshP
MSPERTIQKQAGAGLPIAIFIITVLALLVYGMAQLQESSGQSVSLQIQSQRAFFAAESGAQLAVAEILDSGDCIGVLAELDFTVGALRDCKATLVCSVSDPYPLTGSGGDRVLSLISTGECGAGNELARRSVEVRVR